MDPKPIGAAADEIFRGFVSPEITRRKRVYAGRRKGARTDETEAGTKDVAETAENFAAEAANYPLVKMRSLQDG